jgi:hypothetical protein
VADVAIMKKLKCMYINGYGCFIYLHKQTPTLIQQGGKHVYPAAAEHRKCETTVYR